MKRTRLFWQSIVVVAFAAVGTLFAAQTGDALKPQGDFKHWYLVHSTLITNAHGQGVKEIRVDRRLGVPGVGGR